MTEVAELERAVLALEALNLTGLRAAWRQRWGAPPRLRSVQLLRHLIAWRIQAEALGGLDVETKRLLRATGVPRRGPVMQPGQRLVREWRGRRYDIDVVPDGFTHAGRTFKSLSQVAFAITGTRWNGPRFFGPAGGCLMVDLKPPGRRCAIYTRKSSEEGLEQSFNSLHAQREACDAYIKSQTHEGWRVLAQPYDDGGFSGGSMERPGLAALLTDVELGKIDIVVVYKVDRLTRSLIDFARIVETFDRYRVSFVSVTQAFNTTTSMGRLTLNVLLSFAQFEREVTGERIRDKIAASKAKGMWMGGNLPLGYDRQDNTLVINPAEAAQVKAIFERYLVLCSVDVLRQELAAGGIRSKSRTTRAGKTIGGAVFSRGALYHLLTNLHYRGMIRHKDQHHAGLHSAIIDETLFDAVQRRLAAQRVKRGTHSLRAAAARLTGRIALEGGKALTPSFSYGRGGRIYRYYVAEGALGEKPAASPAPHRVAAEALEAFVQNTLARLAGRPAAGWNDLSPILVKIEVKAQETHVILDARILFISEHPDFALQTLRARLAPGEQAVLEPK